MRGNMKKTNLILAASAVCLVLSATINTASAYFTTYAEAKGGYTIELGDNTRINENFSGWVKYVTITSAEDSEPVYVRARAFSGSQYPLEYSGDGWSIGSDGFYYYDNILSASESTNDLLVQISGVPVNADSDSSFNVIVVYESTPVLYKEDGTPYADWNVKVDTASVVSPMQEMSDSADGVIEITASENVTETSAEGGIINE
jgi:hypothetical protein